MPPKSPDACFYVTEPPEFDYREGLFHITVEVGGLRTERVCKPGVFMEALRGAAECARKHYRGAEVVSIVPKRHAAAASGSPSK